MSKTIIIDWEASTANPRFYPQLVFERPEKQKVSYRVLLEKGQDGWIVAKCLEIKGAISQGKSIDEALRNIVEAISAILEDTHGDHAPEFLITWKKK